MEETGQLKRAAIDTTAGAIAGGISRTVTSPLDVIKIRFQDKWGRGDLNLGYPLWENWAVPLSHKALGEDHIQLSPYLSYVSGALAGCAATVGSYPFDLLRTILASQGEPKDLDRAGLSLGGNWDTVVFHCLLEVVDWDITTGSLLPFLSYLVHAKLGSIMARGFRGLYAGLSPTLVEIIPYAGLQFGTYDTFKRWTLTWNRSRSSKSGLNGTEDGLSSFQLFLCGLAAGTCAKLVCHPLDVVKKRFQIEGLPRHPRYGARVEHRAYRNMFHALRQILQLEGWAGLYKGIVPSTVKAAPAGAVTFVAYEYTSDWLESKLT
uniref:Uncharacterized protein n=1 Tax=Fagus sylvatica TaxID=28930 RepID=A0A2N9IBN1_FAGSY